MKTNMPIFITGIERSGSGIIARVLELAGAWMGKTTSSMENIQLKHLVDSYYIRRHLDINGQHPLPIPKNLFIDHCWRARVLKSLVKDQKYDGQQSWVYKSSRIGQTWPQWNLAFPDAKYVIVRRRTGDVIKSCQYTAYMNAYEYPDVMKNVGVDNEIDGWKWWIHQHENYYVEMIQAGLNCKVVWPDRMLNDDFDSIIELVDWLGLEWNEEIIPSIKNMLHINT